MTHLSADQPARSRADVVGTFACLSVGRYGRLDLAAGDRGSQLADVVDPIDERAPMLSTVS